MEFLREYLNTYTQETGKQGSFTRYKQGAEIAEELYTISRELLILTTVGDNEDDLNGAGIDIKGKDLNELIEEKNVKLYTLYQKIISMRFGYDEVVLNMNNNRFDTSSPDAMTKEDLIPKEYELTLKDYLKHKGVYTSKGTPTENSATFIPMYYRTSTLEFRILEDGVVKMTPLDTDGMPSILIMPVVESRKVLDVMLVDNQFDEYGMSEEEFELLNRRDSLKMAWRIVFSGEYGEWLLKNNWNTYLEHIGEEVETEDTSEVLGMMETMYLEAFGVDHLLEEDLNDNDSVEGGSNEVAIGRNIVKLFVKDTDKIEDNSEQLALLNDAFTKYQAINRRLRQEELEDKSVKMAKVIHTIKEPNQQ